MPIYSSLHTPRSFQYKLRKVRIVIALQGHTHCGADNEPGARRCSVCNRRLKPPTAVKIVLIDGEDAGVAFDVRTPTDEVEDFARTLVEDITATGNAAVKRIRRARRKRRQ